VGHHEPHESLLSGPDAQSRLRAVIPYRNDEPGLRRDGSQKVRRGQKFLVVTNRKLVQASEAFDHADEAEEFQAVGMRCRECLLALVRELTQGSDLDEGEDLPKAGDFPPWNERIANAIAPGDPMEYVRGYLKTTGERGWRLVNWLTHANNATRHDAELGLSATSHIVSNYASAVLKRRAGAPERCGRCKSYRITVDWHPELGLYVPRCEACGAVKMPVLRHAGRKQKSRSSHRNTSPA